MFGPATLIPAPTEPVPTDLTAWAIGACFALGIGGAIGSVWCCLTILDWI